MFLKIFGGGKKPATPSPQESIYQLCTTEDLLVKKQEFLEKKIEAEVAAAKQHGTRNKRLALQALKRKKQFEKQLNHIDGVLSTIEFQRAALENASTNVEVLKVLGNAARALKTAHNEMDVDQVQDLMEDIAEQQEVANEIAEAISSPAGFRNDVEEVDLLKELENLEQEEMDRQLLDVGTGLDSLPEAPSTEIAASAAAMKSIVKATDDGLADLEAWASS
ncbi:hypothetical protein L596_000957 [Steinernema carpocapsae]|uniref:Uncharacterized protein n=1 Tax=Steinernema carpocapsae TaxID=34508 RepID=A0A4U8UJL8_STECR|nr:hypothetical protein L596_000957 [Steinernema carpocapsae]